MWSVASGASFKVPEDMWIGNRHAVEAAQQRVSLIYEIGVSDMRAKGQNRDLGGAFGVE